MKRPLPPKYMLSSGKIASTTTWRLLRARVSRATIAIAFSRATSCDRLTPFNVQAQFQMANWSHNWTNSAGLHQVGLPPAITEAFEHCRDRGTGVPHSRFKAVAIAAK